MIKRQSFLESIGPIGEFLSEHRGTAFPADVIRKYFYPFHSSTTYERKVGELVKRGLVEKKLLEGSHYYMWRAP